MASNEVRARVLFMPATARDGAAALEALGNAGIRLVLCDSFEQMAGGMSEDVGALLLTDLALLDPGFDAVLAALDRQPGWSDLAVVVMARGDNSVARRILGRLTNLTVIDRPGSVRTLVSVLETALRARQRQYQLRDQLLELARAEQLLRAADRRKDEYLATLAHELRNPLSPIRTSAHLLANVPLSREQIVRSAEMIVRQTRTMVALLDDLLDIARISSGKMVLRPAPTPLQGVIDAAVEAVQPLMDTKRHVLHVHVDEPRRIIDCDPLRLAQVLSNLLTNAAKYTDTGGRIELMATFHDDIVEFVVSDNGVGIAPDMLPRLFEMFVQVRDSLDRSQGGLGIGLALALALVEMHGGRMFAHSEGIGQGAVFRVLLPDHRSAARADAAPVAAATDAAMAPTPNAGADAVPARVLVVDDNRDAAQAIAMVLRFEGYEVEEAFDGTQALAAAGAHHPQAMLLDIGMPGLDGYEVARRIRQEPWGPDVVLIACTGWGQPQDKRNAFDAGFDAHLTKPIVPAELIELLATELPRGQRWRPDDPGSARGA